MLRGGWWYEVSSVMLRWKEAEPIEFHDLHSVSAEDSTAEQIVTACHCESIWRALPCSCHAEPEFQVPFHLLN